jgi:predicted AlkP superfamily phosphohydrolase/phosphomutase
MNELDRRNFIRYLLGGAAALAFDWGSLPIAPALATGHDRSVVVLGIDGMDPHLVERLVRTGRMPAFRRLMEAGSFSPLGTTIPPQSPVAWSSFITGQDPGGHGIFDFVHRNPENYTPVFSLSHVDEPPRVITIGDWTIPVSSGKAVLLRKGTAFWKLLDRRGVPYHIYKIPSNFPPTECDGETLSGLGTPDLVGTYGTFSFYTDDPQFSSMQVSGGAIYPVTARGGTIEAELVGPENTLRKERPALRAPLQVHIDRLSRAARITAGGSEIILKEGEWSGWATVSFDVIGPLHRLKGICRFYLKSIEPYFRLYVSPLNIDPSDPALPVSTPGDFASKIGSRIGSFYTQGMAEDTKALEWGVLDDAEYIRQSDIVLEERKMLLDFALDRYRGGFLFFYISTLDLGQHVLWRCMDENHPNHTAEAARHRGQIEEYYIEMDRIVAHVLERIPGDATFAVMSDHGFAPYYKHVNINTWLLHNGYLELKGGATPGRATLLSDAYWRKTRAYALGINGLYVNLRGREGKGVVRPGAEHEELVAELSARLLDLRDPETGARPIKSVYRTGEVYHGSETAKAPDLVIGYRSGYRCSDQSALGEIAGETITLNLSKWSGDHCMAPDEIPGILVANRPLRVADPRLSDFPATILSLFGIDSGDLPSSSREII